VRVRVRGRPLLLSSAPSIATRWLRASRRFAHAHAHGNEDEDEDEDEDEERPGTGTPANLD
jgi:hypothetical protein